MSLVAHVRIAARRVDVRLALHADGSLALLGPNGAGKTSVLESLAGLVTPSGGGAHLDERVLFEQRDGRMTLTPARERRVAIVTQEPHLFATMSVLANVAFGPRSRGVPKADAEATALAWLTRVGLAEMAHRKPKALSGGQARRVALARALASEPKLLLLDEPLAGLDVYAASQFRALLPEAIAGVPTILATHDAMDAVALTREFAVLTAGEVVEAGPTSTLLTQPRTSLTARMVGRQLVPGTITGTVLATEAGLRIPLAVHGLPEGSRAAVALLPRSVRVTVAEAAAAPAHAMDVQVDMVEPHGDVLWVHAGDLVAQAELDQASVLRAGATVRFTVSPGAAAYPL